MYPVEEGFLSYFASDQRFFEFRCINSSLPLSPHSNQGQNDFQIVLEQGPTLRVTAISSRDIAEVIYV